MSAFRNVLRYADEYRNKIYLTMGLTFLSVIAGIVHYLLSYDLIILLDEATASVDPYNEEQTQLVISELVKDKTLVMIAHKLSTITPTRFWSLIKVRLASREFTRS